MNRQLPVLNKLKKLKFVLNDVQQLIRNGRLFSGVSGLHRSLKDQSSSLLRLWSHQCECVLAHRLRRGQQMFSLYTKLWDEQALKLLLKRMRQQVLGRRRDLLYGALGVATYQWEENRIPDEEIYEHVDELDYVYLLQERTMCTNCPDSRQTQKICPCESIDKQVGFDGWYMFIKKKDLNVWRRAHPSGSYEYKVYGSYEDITAEDFLNVQIDTIYRKKWDNTAIALEVIETDPDPSTNTDLVYWEMLWPRFFANRDYVFQRRYVVDYRRKRVILYNKYTEHPDYPAVEDKYRVNDYWSYTVIKPYTELNRSGIEFCLTYFDNPGTNIPTSVTSWVAMKAMPDFLDRLREAARNYKNYCRAAGLRCIFKFDVAGYEEEKQSEFEFDYYDDDIITDNTIFEAQANLTRQDRRGKPGDRSQYPPRGGGGYEHSGTSTVTQPTTNTQLENQGYWKYFHPTYYFS